MDVVTYGLCCLQVLVRTEEITISGSLFRNKLRLSHELVKRTLSNPKKGPHHYRNPARMMWKVIRGMMPHKTARGTHRRNHHQRARCLYTTRWWA